MVWYRVRNLDAARAFYGELLGLEEVERSDDSVLFRRGQAEVGLTQGEPEEEGPVAIVDVRDAKAEAERLRAAGVEVGIVLELAGEIRILDVFDPDGNRIQLAEDVN
jgi:catechol 2,3-dioxygenase-like lactoylglutathione lyase family enzyme